MLVIVIGRLLIMLFSTLIAWCGIKACFPLFCSHGYNTYLGRIADYLT